MKTCSKCGKEKTLEKFVRSRRSREGVCSVCKVCVAKANRANYLINRETYLAKRQEYRQKNMELVKAQQQRYSAKPEVRERRRRRHLQKYDGMSLESYNIILEAQGRVCKICASTATHQRGLVVDHDHKTGKVRGIICHHCNTALGNAFDSIPRLQALIAYLQKHEESA